MGPYAGLCPNPARLRAQISPVSANDETSASFYHDPVAAGSFRSLSVKEKSGSAHKSAQFGATRYIENRNMISKKCLATLTLWPCLLSAQNLKEFEKKVTEFTLPDGLHFIICERHEAPVVSFHTYVNAGSVDDPSGKTGLAHMFEHMAFKGTAAIGSKNWPAEKKALDAIEQVYDRYEAEHNKGHLADKAKLKQLQTELTAAIEKASTYVDQNLYPNLIEENGGVGMNASTGEDSTNYFYSLPSNRIELWFLLESSRFIRPVFREFYKERDVVREERRMRTESEPQGKLFELMLGTAFEAHPYRNPAVGWPSDLDSLRVRDAEEFFQKYYTPTNITMAIVGDVNPAEARRLAEKYFGPIAKRPLPPPVVTVELQQEGEKRAELQFQSQPVEMIAYKRPDQYDKDDPVYDVLSSILSSGRTGLLYREMVRDQKIALEAGAAAQLPGGKYPNLFVFFFAPNLGKTIEENEKSLFAILDGLGKTKVDDATLSRVKTKTRAGLIRSLDSNSGLAQALASYHADYGDWRKLFTAVDDIDKVTAADVERIAKTLFDPASRTRTWIVQPKEEPAK
jgi:predicted Zn-dependent peptidase